MSTDSWVYHSANTPDIPRVCHARIWPVSARLPQKWPVLLQQPQHGAAAGSAIQPDDNLVARVHIGGGEEPEEELVLVGRVIGDGEGAGVGLANVEVDVGNAGAVDLEF